MDYTADDLMHDLWAYLSYAEGEEITINRNYLYQKLLHLQRDSYDRGYSRGAKHSRYKSDEKPNPMNSAKITWAYEFIDGEDE